MRNIVHSIKMLGVSKRCDILNHLKRLINEMSLLSNFKVRELEGETNEEFEEEEMIQIGEEEKEAEFELFENFKKQDFEENTQEIDDDSMEEEFEYFSK